MLYQLSHPVTPNTRKHPRNNMNEQTNKQTSTFTERAQRIQTTHNKNETNRGKRLNSPAVVMDDLRKTRVLVFFGSASWGAGLVAWFQAKNQKLVPCVLYTESDTLICRIKTKPTLKSIATLRQTPATIKATKSQRNKTSKYVQFASLRVRETARK